MERHVRQPNTIQTQTNCGEHTTSQSLSCPPFLSLSLYRQVIGIVMVLICQAFQFPLSDDLVAINKCVGVSSSINESSVTQCSGKSPSNFMPYKNSTPLYDPRPIILLFLGILFVNSFFVTLCLWPKYKRLNSEKINTFEKSVCVRK